MRTKTNRSPYVGMPATKHYFSDSQAAIVTQVISDKRIVVELFKYPSYGDDEEIDVTKTNTYSHRKEVYTKRKSGHWREVGTPDKSGQCYLTLGYAHSYYCREV